MKIYVGHSTKYDYKNEIYKPLLDSILSKKVEFILPHNTDKTFNSKEVIENSNLFIAEISEPSLGLGIEIGRAEMKGKKILCMCNDKDKVPSSLKHVNMDVITYSDRNDMIRKIEEYVYNNFSI